MSVMAITTREWNRISNDYKTEIDGKRTMLYYSPRYGTCSIPVVLDDENGREYGKYHFSANGSAYSVYAYSMAEVLRIIRSVGHNVFKVTDLEREIPYKQHERAEIINGRIVYIIGNDYEISDDEWLEMVCFGNCESDTKPQEVYAANFPHLDRGGESAPCFRSFIGNQCIRAGA